ncbi:imm11 family protein [Pseudovibrio sp. Ad37]|uniref:imm11 family protein n=1 Tax=Pseudovibrio sp. Ad37 TaxID=989422 RepID=UPI0007AE7B67|nr:DUF1629 domain-containing protein [Pseudovibrio sp. Ad37]KZL26095.1 hypothetical protein PsAD37_02067 [Pseudovibrio sp. Ad37]
MQVFEITRDFEFKHYANGIWSADRTQKSALKLNAWNPVLNLSFDENGRIDPSDASKFTKNWFVITVKELVPLDVIGVLSQDPRLMPAVNAVVKDALERVAPGTAQFIEIDQIWAEYQNCAVPGGPFYLANLLVSQDSWDSDAMTISKMEKRDGSSMELVEGARRAVRQSALTSLPIWRESRTGHVLCTDVMKDALQAAGCRGWYFRPVTVTER